MNDELDIQRSDAPYGQLLFFVFTVAVLLVTLAIALLTVVQSYWMLGVVFGFDIIVTVAVGWVIARGLNNRTQLRVRRAESGRKRAGAQSASRDHLRKTNLRAV